MEAGCGAAERSSSYPLHRQKDARSAGRSSIKGKI